METKNHYPTASSVFDWLFVLFSGIWISGLYLDGWAHIHLDSALETFFTPWHAVFYSGATLTALLVIICFLKYRSLKDEYKRAAWGLAIFFIGGAFDLGWHQLFGIEANLDALLSPAHIILAIGLAIATSALRNTRWLKVISLTYLFLIISFILQFLHPLQGEFTGSIAVASVIVFSALFIGITSIGIRSGRFPFGAFTVMLTINTLAITLMQGEYEVFIISTFIAGVIIDIVYRMVSFRLLTFLAPAIFFSFYVLTILVENFASWSVHMWTGIIVISGLTGLLLSYVRENA